MADHRLIVFSAPTPGKEEEYHDWYNNTHLSEVIAIPGFAAAQRFELSTDQLDGFTESPYKYLAIYEFDRDPATALSALHSELESGRISLPESIQVSSICPWAYSSISTRATSQA
jgi:hypothetical protein